MLSRKKTIENVCSHVDERTCYLSSAPFFFSLTHSHSLLHSIVCIFFSAKNLKSLFSYLNSEGLVSN